MKPSTVLDRVKRKLKLKPELRDNTKRLVAEIWWLELKQMYGGVGVHDVDLPQFFGIYSEGELTDHGTIARCSRKLQEEFPELRGKEWEKRQRSQKTTIDDLRETPEFYKGGTP